MTTQPQMLAKLPDRCLISITGEDRLTFLQGLITADINQLESKKSLWSAILTPQGRLIADFFILAREQDVIWLDCATSQQDIILNFFKKFCLRSRVSLTPQSGTIFALWNGDTKSNHPAGDDTYTDPRLAQMGERIVVIEEDAPEPNASNSDYEAHRLALGIPDPSVDAHAKETLPAECNMDILGGISWDKGCYIGQEITARLHYRNKLKKRLIPITSATTLPEAGTSILSGEKVVGDMRSSCGKEGLAMLKTNSDFDYLHLENGEKLHARFPSWLKKGLEAEEGNEK